MSCLKLFQGHTLPPAPHKLSETGEHWGLELENETGSGSRETAEEEKGMIAWQEGDERTFFRTLVEPQCLL